MVALVGKTSFPGSDVLLGATVLSDDARATAVEGENHMSPESKYNMPLCQLSYVCMTTITGPVNLPTIDVITSTWTK